MGNDGGSIPTRRELVKEAARQRTITELKETQHEQQEYYWSTDPLSRRPLARPIVSDSSGKLYNKDSILEFLIPSDVGGEASKAEAETVLLGAVKSLKDVVEVKFEVDQDDNADSVRNGTVGGEKWVCPITNKSLGPGSRAVYLVPCGHAFADSAIKEVAEDKCLQCDKSYASNDVIPILPTSAEDIARLSLRVKTLKENGLTHSLKKAAGSGKKRKKNAETERSQQNASEAPTTLAKKGGMESRADSGIRNAATASLTAKVLEEQDERNKKRKMARNGNLDQLFSSKDPNQTSEKRNDFMNRGFTIPANATR